MLLDAALELVIAVALALWPSTLADLYNVDPAVMWVLSGVFVAAAVAIAAIALSDLENRDLVWSLAALNIVGGLVLWGVFLTVRSSFDPGGSWLIPPVANSFILIGLLEIAAVRRAAGTA